jgi:hypothetical protein
MNIEKAEMFAAPGEGQQKNLMELGEAIAVLQLLYTESTTAEWLFP